MSVALDRRPTVAPARTDTGGGPARRAVVRWSWRLFRREWRQQLLVLTLLTVAVAATTFGLAVAVNATSPPQTVLTLPGNVPRLDDDVAALRQAYGPLTVIHHRRIPVPGSVATVDLRAEDRGGTNPTLRVRAGRLPTAPGEVAFTTQVARLFDLRIGDTWHDDGLAFRVVGMVENPKNLDDAFALVAPGQVEPATTITVVPDRNPSHVGGVQLPSGTPLTIESESPTARQAAAAAVLALGTIGLLFVGLVAVAGFTVMAQRRLRALGMLGSLGATDRHIRLVMLANGAVVGTVAAGIGALAGLGAWIGFAPRLEAPAGHRIDRFALPWWAIAAALVLAVLTALLAAWWPARSASRVSVVAALSGRPPRPQPAHRFAALGGMLLLAGILLLALGQERRALLVVSGTTATIVGLLLLAPLAIRVLAGAGRHARIGVRLALRDLARYQARSGAALGAITLAVAIAAGIAGSAAAVRARNGSSTANLASNQILVRFSGGGPKGPVPAVTSAEQRAAQSRVDHMARALHTSDVVALQEAVNPAGPGIPALGDHPGGKEPAALVRVTNTHAGFAEELVTTAYVATPAVLAHYGLRAASIPTSVDVVTSRRDAKSLRLAFGPRLTIVPKTQLADLPHETSAPNTLITTAAVKRLGLETVPAAWLLQTARPLTGAQVNTARNVAAAGGLTIETRENRSSLVQLGDDATAAGIALALGVLAMTVGLIRSETAQELRTLTATGAGPRTRRTLTAATAGALALLGGVVGTGGAYLALVAWYRSELDNLAHLPVRNLVALTIGLPLVAAIAGWLLAGREPPAIARRPLE